MTELHEERKYLLGWTDKEGGHKYFSHCYEELFTPYRDKPIDLLEVGCGYGGALTVWNDWFHDANLTGVEHTDHRPESKKIRGQTYSEVFLFNEQDHPRIKLIVQDAYTEELANTLGEFDIIVDDGYHTIEQWNKLIKLYLPKLKPGGIMCIEDIGRRLIDRPNGFDIQELINLVPNNKTQVFDMSAITTSHDSRILVIWK